MPKKMLALVFVIYVFISHVILPHFLKRESFLFFSNWALFNRPPAHYVTDLSCDQGKTFILRDNARAARIGMMLNPLIYLLINNDIKKIREIHKQTLLNFCHQRPVSYVVIKNTIYSHFIEKTTGEIIHIEQL